MRTIFDEIKEHVSIFDMCDLAGVQYSTKQASHKVFCPFHDDTTTKSGYLYHDTNVFRCFTCAKSWDVVDFWAQHNEWYKDESREKLDVGRAIADLKERYGLEVVAPSWEQKYFALKHQETPTGFQGYSLPDRVKLRDYYAWNKQLELRTMDKTRRKELVERACTLWDQLEAVDLEQDGWKDHLNKWLESSKMLS